MAGQVFTPQPSDWDTLKPKIEEQQRLTSAALEAMIPEREADFLRGKLAAYRDIIDTAEPTARPGGTGTRY